MWNTGCNRISNRLNAPLFILDGEDTSLKIQIPPGGVSNWESVIFPWCNRNEEIVKKAFRVTNQHTGKTFLYIYQDFHSNEICWSLSDDEDMWTNRRVVTDAQNRDARLAPKSAIDIMITADNVWGFETPSENKVFGEVLNVVVQVARVAGQVLTAML